ncbi:MAG TPA: beta-ketoacyl-[acyl-carrier-protein] synthase II, partial [Firmicutes bacterium]|nr:beta-ketoacyl-[acyl-carrier-protein] synthase II [Bacillota bacterium]
MNRVVITGIGAVTPLGLDKNTLWKNLAAGRSGISRVESIDVSAYPSQIGGEIKDFDPHV